MKNRQRGNYMYYFLRIAANQTCDVAGLGSYTTIFLDHGHQGQAERALCSGTEC